MPAPPQIKDALINGQIVDFAVFSPSGEVEEKSGVFASDKNKCDAALAALQHTSALMKAGEKLKRITISFEDVAYTATVVPVGGKNYGVVARQQVGQNGETDALA
jgi:hypothetical protein